MVEVLMSCPADLKVTQRSFNFGKKKGLPLYFVSAADGTNVVKVQSSLFSFPAVSANVSFSLFSCIEEFQRYSLPYVILQVDYFQHKVITELALQ